MSNLSRAMCYWANGYRIPVDLAMKLATEGYDVKALEARHLG